VEAEGQRWLFLAFGWEVIGCRGAGRGTFGVNPLRPAHVLASLGEAARREPGAAIVLLMHWDYELELYPQPLHRRLAHAAVEAGASAVVGCHSHCVQGIEIHRGAPIVYGLGNWLIPDGVFYGGRLAYPELCKTGLAFEWRPGAEPRCHWLRYRREGERHVLAYQGGEPASQSARVAGLTPFRGLSHEAYLPWFRANRRKRRLLPVYADARETARNHLRDAWVWARGRVLDGAFARGLKGGPR
jgi:poly-gamma-glutamate synthesis protein (capsule biosynthesis protein)